MDCASLLSIIFIYLLIFIARLYFRNKSDGFVPVHYDELSKPTAVPLSFAIRLVKENVPGRKAWMLARAG